MRPRARVCVCVLGLQYHRDFLRRSRYKQLKICDFGISAFLPATQAGDTSNLDLGSGTPAMMAPELFSEVLPEPDPSVDMYLLDEMR